MSSSFLWLANTNRFNFTITDWAYKLDFIIFCSPWNHQKTSDFLKISGGMAVNLLFSQVRLILDVKFRGDPLLHSPSK